MAYTPELSLRASRTLRRISWALGVPMTKGIEFVFEFLPLIMEREKVCGGCRDRAKCAECSFNKSPEQCLQLLNHHLSLLQKEVRQ
jgi:hypothetical protein